MSKSLRHLFTACCIAAASLFSISCEGPAGPAGDGFGTLDDPSVMPVVAYTYPQMNSVGPYPDFYVYECDYGACRYYSVIQLRFNKLMDISSVRRAVRIASSSGAITTDTSRITSYGGDLVMVTPVDSNGISFDPPYEVGEVYTLVVDTTAFDINGNRLATPFTTTFVPEPYLRVTAMTPPDGSTGAFTTEYIKLEFNSPVDQSIIPFIRLSPAEDFLVAFDGYYRSIYIYPLNPLSVFTTYAVGVDSGAPDANGHTLRAPYSGVFTTVGFGVLFMAPGDGDVGVGLADNFSFRFSSVIDTASFRAAFSVDPPVEGRFIYNYYTTGFGAAFEPAGGWDQLASYTVTLDTTMRSVSGARLPAPLTSSFSTGRFAASIKAPTKALSGTSRYPYIPVTSNGPLDTSTIAGAISLVPAVPLNFLLTSGRTGFTVVPSVLLAPSTEYTLKVDTTLKTIRGVRLSTPITRRFTTAPLE